MSRVVVYHGSYGCDTGCCGHYVEIGGLGERFTFDHPEAAIPGYNKRAIPETPREFAERVIREQWGDEHVKDLDWDNCEIVDD